jgi:multimeric flavodoxin WrbA
MSKIKVLGISGSPIDTSNTDILIQTILDATGLKAELIKLANIEVKPCRHCRKCAYTNECVIEDDFKWLSQKVMEADGIVLGSPTIYGLPSSFMNSFNERLYSKRHVKLLLKGKIGAAVAIGWIGQDFVSQHLQRMLQTSGIEVLGGVTANGTPGCFVCGPGATCMHSIWNSAKMMENITGQATGVENIYEGYLEELPDNDPFVKPSYKILGYISVKDQPEKMEEAKKIGKLIGEKLQ